MKQIVQIPGSGSLELLEVPAPAPVPGQLIVRNAFSVVSPGTEKMALEFAREGANVAICARGAEALEKTRGEIAALGVTVHAASCDVGNADALDHRSIDCHVSPRPVASAASDAQEASASSAPAPSASRPGSAAADDAAARR